MNKFKKIPALLVTLLFLIQNIAFANAAGEKITYYHNDHLGSPIMATDEQGQVEWVREYSAFGDPAANGAKETIGYTGHEYAPESNLTYMGARWYNSELGRFMAPDPVTFVPSNNLSFNRYLYVNNNPYSYFDPDGNLLDVFSDVISIGLGISSGVQNYKEGNWGSLAVDVVGVLIDSAAAVVPFVPAGVGYVRTAAKNADEVFSAGGYRPDRVLPRDKDGIPLPDSDLPHTQLGTKEGRNGDYTQAREFGENGKPVRDIDFTDHGRPKSHENPHQHDWVPNPTGGTPQRGPSKPLEF